MFKSYNAAGNHHFGHVMFFRCFFSIWFLLFTLTSSIAWAQDDHLDESHHKLALEFASDHDGPLPWLQDGCSDHCCHASAHALGIITSVIDIDTAPLADNVFVTDSLPLSLTLSPPFRPPIT
jgi:hypothetical protein